MINKFLANQMKSFKLYVIMLFLIIIAANTSSAAPFRVGYIEAGPFFTYSETMKVIKSEIKRLGYEDKIVFPDDASFSPGWDPEAKAKILPKRAKELMARDDLDLIIASGTSGNREILKANNGKIAILGICVSDAVKAGFVPNHNDSGADNYTVRIVPERYIRMFQLFHDVISFKKLGLLYFDEGSRNSVANADDAIEVSKARGYKVLEQKIDNNNDTELCLNGLKSLVEKGMDAFFVPSLTCFDWKTSDTKKLYDYLFEHNIPTFARSGSKDVKSGALMGFSTIDFTHRGKLHAEKIVEIFKGTKPRDLKMIDAITPKLSFNLATAKKINFNPPIDLLGSTDELFEEFVLPEDRKFK